jgi:serine/threonine-protein kinase HipA
MNTQRLNVFIHNQKVGVLQDIEGTLSFSYDITATIPISFTLPIREKSYNDKECRPFFENLLPEGTVRKLVAEKELVSGKNAFSLLNKIGGDCAGAISLYETQPDNKKAPQELREITESELYKIIKNQNISPLLTSEKIRLSLAGAQSKFAVYKNEDKIFYPNDTYFSTHLIKPESQTFNNLVINEYFCMQLANGLNIPVPKVEIKKSKDKEYLLIDRYDRKIQDQIMFRIHQEDFCQILGKTSDIKYQKEGGPSFKDCFDFIKENINIASAEKFLTILIFNYLIGNCDAHAKNFSVLHNEHNFSLAPFYDLVSTDVYEEIDKSMAMEIGNTWDIRAIQKYNLYYLAEQNKIKPKEIDSLLNKFSNIIDIAKKITTNIHSQGYNTSICEKIITGINKRYSKITTN